MRSVISPEWFVIRVTYGREMKLKSALDENKLESYIPMRYEEKIKRGRKQRVLVPVIRNLIFIRSTREVLDTLKRELESTLPMRYLMDRTIRKPIVVREKEMQHFIAVSGTLDEQLIYLDHADASHLQKGKRVRVTDGPFIGVEGTVVRIRQDRRVLVSLDGVLSIATAHIHPSLLQEVP